MQPQQFRIGNWIADENDFPMQVVTIGTDYICADFEGNEGDIWEFDFKNNFPKPIKLTEEILLKCPKFIKQNTKVFSSKYIYKITKTKCIYISDIGTPNLMMGIYETELDDERQISDLIVIHNFDFNGKLHLHQLQNIIFCLTGKELEYKQ